MSELRRCQFCNSTPAAPFENLRDDDDDSPIKVWTIRHYCHAIDLWVEGDDGDECAERWNALNASQQHSAQGE